MSVRKVLESQPFLITANVLSGVLSIVVIGLVGANLAWANTRDAKTGTAQISFNITLNDTELTDTAVVAYTPLDLRLGSYWLMLAAGIGGFIDAILLGLVQCWRRLKSASIQVEHGETYDRNLRPQTPIAIFIAAFAFCRSLAATIYAFQEWAGSGTFTPSESLPLNNAGKYEQDYFTVDAWTCQYEDYVTNDPISNRMEQLCTQGTAARTVTLAACIINLCVLYGVVYRAWRRRSSAQRNAEFRGFESSNGTSTMRTTTSERTFVAPQTESKVLEK